MADFEKRLKDYTSKERIDILDNVQQLLDETEGVDDAMCYFEDIESDYDMWWEDAKEIINHVYLVGKVWPE